VTGERLPAAEARQLAAELVDELRAEAPSLLELDGVNLGEALEQQLFFALRDGRRVAVGTASRARRLLGRNARMAAAAAASTLGWRAPDPGPRPITVLVAAPVHVRTLLQVEAILQEEAGASLSLVRIGRAARTRPPHAVAPRLADLLDPRLIRGLLAANAGLSSRLRRGTASWERRLLGSGRAAELREIATEELARIGLGAMGLASVARRWRPALLAAFDEVGTWARLLPAVAERYAIPSLDLPHAEAADAVATRGAGYDRFAVYGPLAAAVLREAGIRANRITEIGAPRFDPLIQRGPAAAPANPPRVVFAAQYVQGAMTSRLLADAYVGAVAAAETIAPAELVIVPHPAEQPGLIAGIVAGLPQPAGVSVRVAGADALHAELPAASLLVTGWSNSVLEAAICGVPALTVSPRAVAPVDFAADGLALSAESPGAAAAAALRLLDPAHREGVVDRARAAAVRRLGPLDGRASERAARIMLEMAGVRGQRPG
jgi:hypothetical protein